MEVIRLVEAHEKRPVDAVRHGRTHAVEAPAVGTVYGIYLSERNHARKQPLKVLRTLRDGVYGIHTVEAPCVGKWHLSIRDEY
jgi:hypothetical protein